LIPPSLIHGAENVSAVSKLPAAVWGECEK
jgi:hypothetical protein